MSVTYHFNSVDELDQAFIDSIKKTFKGKRFKFNIEIESNEKLSPEIEAAIERVENGVEFIEFESMEALETKLYEEINKL